MLLTDLARPASATKLAVSRGVSQTPSPRQMQIHTRLATARRENLSEFSQILYSSSGPGKGLQPLQGLP
jgi:hypothetical protein